MRPIPLLITISCLILISGFLFRLWRQPQGAGRRQGETRTQPSEPRGAVPPPGTSGKSNRDPSNKAAPVETPANSGVAKIDATHLSIIQKSIERWSFSSEDEQFLEKNSSASEVRPLAAAFQLRKIVWQTLRVSANSIPDSVQRVELKNGHVLWARTVEKQEDKVAIALLGGVRTTFDAGEVANYAERTRSSYLHETRAEFDARSAELVKGKEPSQREAMRLALCRGDYTAANAQFERWLAAGGPYYFARTLIEQDAARLRESAGQLRIPDPESDLANSSTTSPSGARGSESGTPEQVQPASPAGGAQTSTTSTTSTTAAATHVPPTSPQDLRAKILAIRKEVKPQLSQTRQQELLDELVYYDAWLESAGRAQKVSGEELRQMQRDLQFLRLDIIKNAGI